MTMIEKIDPYEVYERIFDNKPYGKNLKIYSTKIINSVIKLLIQYEEYEMCFDLEKYLEDRLNHEKNYKEY